MGTKHKTENEAVINPVIALISNFHYERMLKYIKAKGLNNSTFIRMAISEKLDREGYLDDYIHP